MKAMALMIEGDPRDPVAFAAACEAAKQKALSELPPNLPASLRAKAEAAMDAAISALKSKPPLNAALDGVIGALEECMALLPEIPKALIGAAAEMASRGDNGAHVFKLGALCSDIETAANLLEGAHRGLREILACRCHEHDEKKPERPAPAQA